MKIAMWASVMLGICACGKHPQTGQGSAANALADEPNDPPPPPTVKPSKKGDCRTDYAPRPKRDPNPMCKVDGGTFTMGDANEHMLVKLSPYYIDQFEVTNAQVAHYLNATRGKYACAVRADQPATGCIPVDKETDHGSDSCIFRHGSKFTVLPSCARFPFMEITKDAAIRYCEWAGKELPTEARWEFAARHDPKTNSDYLYPWGNEFDGRRARCDHASCPDGPVAYGPVAVGTYDGTNGHADGSSPWGLYDMVGNAEEVVLGCANDYHPCQGPCVDPQGEPARPQQPCGTVSRGGEAGTPGDMLTVTRRWQDQAGLGFRCARDLK